jgi:hypothetical protein
VKKQRTDGDGRVQRADDVVKKQQGGGIVFGRSSVCGLSERARAGDRVPLVHNGPILIIVDYLLSMMATTR